MPERQDERRARLAAALRANLRRRKAAGGLGQAGEKPGEDRDDREGRAPGDGPDRDAEVPDRRKP